MIALGIILLVLCLLFLVWIAYRQEFRAWQRERRARRKTMHKLFDKGDRHDGR